MPRRLCKWEGLRCVEKDQWRRRVPSHRFRLCPRYEIGRNYCLGCNSAPLVKIEPVTLRGVMGTRARHTSVLRERDYLKERFGKAPLLIFAAVLSAAIIGRLPSSNTAVASVLPRSLTVTVVDRDTLAPVFLAHVELESNTELFEGFTNALGVVRFSQLPLGDYHITVTAVHFKIDPPSHFVVLSSSQQLRILAVRTRPRIIAEVEATRKPKQQTIKSTSLLASLYGGTGIAASLLPEVSSSRFADLSIHGHSPEDTSATIDGAPIFPTGYHIAANLLASDIFEGASANVGALPGAPGGSMGYTTFDPSIDWFGALMVRGSSFGGESSTILEHGTSGRVGVALSFSSASTPDALNGSTFLDQSGLSYSHDTARQNGGTAVTIRYPFTSNHVAFFDYGRLSSSDGEVCEFSTGGLPCGSGPVKGSNESIAYEQLRDFLTFRSASVALHVFHSLTDSSTNMNDAYFLGVPAGFDAFAQTTRNGVSAHADFFLSHGREATADFSTFTDDSTGSASSYLGSAFIIPPGAQTSTAFSAQIPFVTQRRFSLSGGLGVETIAGVNSATASAGASYTIFPGSMLLFNAAIGNLSPETPSSNGITGAEGTMYDCANHKTLGEGPLSGSRGAKTASYRLSFERDAKAGQLMVSLFHDRERSPLILGALPGTTLPSLVTPTYLADLNAAAQGVCGSAQFLTPSTSFFTVGGIAASATYEGIDASVPLLRLPRMSMHVNASFIRARAYGLPTNFASALDVRAGHQLPLVPSYQMQVTEAYAIQPHLDLLAVENIFGKNNAYQQAPFVSGDIGMRLQLPSAVFTFEVQNLSGAASPLLNRFSPFPFQTAQFLPRTYSFQFQVPLGNRAIDHGRLLATSQIQPTSSLFFIPVPFAARRHKNWLGIDASSPFCGPELKPTASKFLAAIGAFNEEEAAAFDAHRRFIQEKNVDGMVMAVIPAPTGYAIRINLPNDARVLAPIWKCARLHEGNVDTARKLGLPIQTWRERYAEGAGTLFFAPQAGLYFSPDPMDEMRSSLRTAPAFPDVRDLGALRAEAKRCPAPFLPAMNELLSRLGNALMQAEGTKKSPTVPKMKISRHTAKAGVWYEILPDEESLGEAMIQCVGVPHISLGQAAQMGLGSAPQPSINYSSGVGFYVISQ